MGHQVGVRLHIHLRGTVPAALGIPSPPIFSLRGEFPTRLRSDIQVCTAACALDVIRRHEVLTQ